jgi:hypothetical protein
MRDEEGATLDFRQNTGERLVFYLVWLQFRILILNSLRIPFKIFPLDDRLPKWEQHLQIKADHYDKRKRKE